MTEFTESKFNYNPFIFIFLVLLACLYGTMFFYLGKEKQREETKEQKRLEYSMGYDDGVKSITDSLRVTIENSEGTFTIEDDIEVTGRIK